MKRILALTTVCALLLSGCEGLEFLPYARELEGMALMRTLGVDAAENGVAVTASAGGQDGEKTEVTEKTAASISAAVLGMQAEGASYVYFGHVGQLLLGEALAQTSIKHALDYVLRDVEMRLDTGLYMIKDGSAKTAIQQAAETDSATSRLEAAAEDAGLTSWSMVRTVGAVLADLERCGASFAPALGTDLSVQGYAILKQDRLVGWADEEAAHGINLLLGQVDADIVEVDTPEGSAVLRVVGAKTCVHPVMRNGVLTELEIRCKVDANLAETATVLQSTDILEELEQKLIQVETERIRAALLLAQNLNADFLDLQSAAGLSAPWHWETIQNGWENWTELDLSVAVQAELERSYDARETERRWMFGQP